MCYSRQTREQAVEHLGRAVIVWEPRYLTGAHDTKANTKSTIGPYLSISAIDCCQMVCNRINTCFLERLLIDKSSVLDLDAVELNSLT